MYDHLKDIVTHTHALGFIDLVKITGEKTKTTLDAMASDRTVVVNAKFHAPLPEFMGTFGLPNLDKLAVILNIPEYQKNATISVNRKAVGEGDVPVGLHFENEAGDFKNDYRFMSAEVVATQLSTVEFRGAKWEVTIVPTAASIQRFKYQSQANGEELTFVTKTSPNADGTTNDLQFFFGDHSSHAGNFVFQTGVKGKLSKEWAWPVSQVLAILNLAGDKVLNFSDSSGAAMITVDSGLAEYNYILPAHQK
jgi:hypothetical protein